MQDNYPELLGRMLVVNTPWVFSSIWSIIKGWVDEKTRAKIAIVNAAGSREALLEYIHEDVLIDFLGGNNPARLEDNTGPWENYELVDGKEPEDVVGVRLKNDPNGRVFTPQDLERLPNYLIMEGADLMIPHDYVRQPD